MRDGKKDWVQTENSISETEERGGMFKESVLQLRRWEEGGFNLGETLWYKRT